MTKFESNIDVARLDSYRHLPSNSRLTAGSAAGSLTDAPRMMATVFLDRDGVLNKDVDYLTDPKDLKLLPGVAQAINSFQDRYFVIVATNQSAIARDMLSEEGLLDIHRELVQLLDSQGAVVDAFYYCPHLPDAPVEAYRNACNCRKPSPGMLLNASKDWGIRLDRSFMIGDNIRDVEAGTAAGARGILISSETRRPNHSGMTAHNLAGAAQIILGSGLSSHTALDLPGEIR